MAIDYPQIEGCDFSPSLLELAKQQSPKIKFQLADLNKRLPYGQSQFDAVVLNMVAHDVKDLPELMAGNR